MRGTVNLHSSIGMLDRKYGRLLKRLQSIAPVDNDNKDYAAGGDEESQSPVSTKDTLISTSNGNMHVMICEWDKQFTEKVSTFNLDGNPITVTQSVTEDGQNGYKFNTALECTTSDEFKYKYVPVIVTAILSSDLSQYSKASTLMSDLRSSDTIFPQAYAYNVDGYPLSSAELVAWCKAAITRIKFSNDGSLMEDKAMYGYTHEILTKVTGNKSDVSVPIKAESYEALLNGPQPPVTIILLLSKTKVDDA